MTLQLDANDFQNEDLTSAQVTTGRFEPNGSGIYLTSLDSALPWLQSTSNISVDEIAILLLGHVKVETAFTCKFVQFRALQQSGGVLLLRGTLFQLGAKQITMVEGKSTRIACPNTSVATFTAHADEFSSTIWSELVASPGKFMLDSFDPDTRRQAVLGIWGHSYQLKGKRSKPAECDSVQFHARILTGNLAALLRQSGWNSVYMVPKCDGQDRSGMPDTQYAVIWTGQPKQETMVAAKEIQATLGLVRNRTSIGIRVDTTSFESAWKKIHPKREVPTSVRVQNLFKAQNLPNNITIIELRKWLESIQWVAKPLKKLTHTSWLLGSDGAPPQLTYVFNDNVVLLTQMERKQGAQTPVLAGKPIATSRASDAVPKPDNQVPDAWAQWKLKHPGQNAVYPNQPPAQQTRSVDGPVNAKLSEQDAKIEQLSRNLESLQNQVQNDNQAVRHEVQNQADQFQKFTAAVDQRLAAQAAETTNKFSSLQVAVDAGRQAQDEQFKILRDMLMNANPASARKGHKADGNTTPGGKDDGLGN